MTYCLLSPLPPDANQGVMVFFNVKIQEVLRWEILSALNTAVDMCFRIMYIILFE